MSNMIPSGNYVIQNVLYSERYTAMAGPDNNSEVVGHDVPNTIKVDVLDLISHLATLYDTNKGKYITIENGLVVGRDEPQVLQLSSEDGENFTIHEQDINLVGQLPDGGNWTPVIAAPAPHPGVEGSTRKYWKFVPA
ncbi:hypothetical protein DEU56DRAFT_756664 [Suillus clintonianus]|uniref:uncharacterized protein n=1 Tax=Suillus clintonianus TaxID=1904413 RepID=UPI001B8603AA|nr:uncharacterized protein DEU56DRAFT_756664 [Suillus clintonianus]KAG2135265.1 hypothetical protein DEU56DRAFT_756664 [Suillus clintonianus]